MPQPSADTLDPLAAAASRDQRSEPRKPLAVDAMIHLPDGDPVGSAALNLSAHGMVVRCAVHLPPASRFEVAFNLPVDGGERPLRLHACVVRHHPVPGGYELGLQFLGPPQRAQELIEFYVFG